MGRPTREPQFTSCLSTSRLDRRLVADRQRGDPAGDSPVLDLCFDGVAQMLPKPVERAPRIDRQRCRAVVERCTNLAGGADALLEPPQLGIEAMRVHRGVGLAQPDQERTPLGRSQPGPGRCRGGVGPGAIVGSGP